MGRLVFDREALAIVQLARGSFTTATLDEIISTATTAAEVANERGETIQWLTIIEDAAEAPGSIDRKRIIDAVNSVPRLNSAIVVTSRFHRTILVAFAWLLPVLPGHRFGTFASTEDAIRWLEGLAGPRPWRRLVEEAQRSG